MQVMTSPEPHALYSLTLLYGAEDVTGSPYIFLSDGELLDSDDTFINKELYAFPEESMAPCKDEMTYNDYNINHETRYDLVPINDPNSENDVRYELVPVKNEAAHDGEKVYNPYAELAENGGHAAHDGDKVYNHYTELAEHGGHAAHDGDEYYNPYAEQAEDDEQAEHDGEPVRDEATKVT